METRTPAGGGIRIDFSDKENTVEVTELVFYCRNTNSIQLYVYTQVVSALNLGMSANTHVKSMAYSRTANTTNRLQKGWNDDSRSRKSVVLQKEIRLKEHVRFTDLLSITVCVILPNYRH